MTRQLSALSLTQAHLPRTKAQWPYVHLILIAGDHLTCLRQMPLASSLYPIFLPCHFFGYFLVPIPINHHAATITFAALHGDCD